jgi:hypothetical protein
MLEIIPAVGALVFVYVLWKLYKIVRIAFAPMRPDNTDMYIQFCLEVEEERKKQDGSWK